MKFCKYFAFLLLPILVSCKKYPDGPSLSLQPKKWRLSGTWQVESFYVNTQDLTNAYFPNKVYFESYDANKKYEVNDAFNKQIGTWKFTNKREKLYRSASLFGTVALEVTILRLTSKELWYSYTDGTANYEMHLVQN